MNSVEKCKTKSHKIKNRHRVNPPYNYGMVALIIKEWNPYAYFISPLK